MTMLKNCLFLIATAPVLLNAHAAGQGSPCPASGATLSVDGGSLGDLLTISVQGAPLASGVLAADVTPGPIASPIGAICLGMTPALILFPFSTDAAGEFQITGSTPTSGTADGLSFFLQAALLGPAPSPSLALSNGATLNLRSPRLYMLDGGDSTFFYVPGNVLSLDALNQAFDYVTPLPRIALEFIRVPTSEQLIVVQDDGSFTVLNELTGGIVSTHPPTFLPTFSPILILSEDESTLVLLNRGLPAFPFGPPATPPVLHTFSLPGLNPLQSVVLPVQTVRALFKIPGASVVLAESDTSYVAVDTATGTVLATIPMAPPGTSIGASVRIGGLLYTLIGGTPGPGGIYTSSAALNALDLTTLTPVNANPIPLGINGGGDLKAGPGSTGPALLAVLYPSYTVAELDPTTFTVLGTATLPGSPINLFFEPSAGGTEWIIVEAFNTTPTGAPVPPNLVTVSMPSMTVSTIGQLPLNVFLPLDLVITRSQSLRQGFIAAFTGQVELHPFATDPTALPGPPIPLPNLMNPISIIQN